MGWGRPTQNFVLHITPSGTVRGIQLGSSISRGNIPFKQGDKVSLNDLIRFERESGFDLHMRGRIREQVIKEQESISQDAQLKMTPAVWKITQMAMKLGEGTYRNFLTSLVRYFNLGEDDAAFLWLLLTANADRLEISIPEVLQLNYNEIEVPELWENTIEFNDDYAEEENEDDCDEGGGYGAESGNECECEEYEEIEVTRKEEDGEEYLEYVDCFSATDKELEEQGYNDKWDCQCEEWEIIYYKKYYYPSRQAIVITHKQLEEQLGDVYNYTYHDLLDEVSDWWGVVTDDDHYEDNYDEAESWDYFNDDEEGLIRDWYSDNLDTESMMYMINQNFYKESPLLEQEGEQLKMWPTGHWDYPVSGLDKMEMKYVQDALPEALVTKIFKRWDEKGIDFSILKMLGIDKGFALLGTMLLKRYSQFGTKPIPVSVTYDCDDLKELFERESRDYSLDYIEEYICGKDSFWDHEDWYNYEWDSYMTDAIDENNWKTISEIFGGVSQSVAEDILQRSSSSEEVDELIEKYDEEIDEIQNYIVWANADETEYATKDAMAKDIEDKLAEHFQHEGRLNTDNKGSKSWIIEGDLRDYVNDIWDNTEDVFEYHPDYANTTIEDVLLGYSDSYLANNLPNLLFQALMDEEYRFWDYCEGKQGECLNVDTKFFDGYWYPNIDINDSLADRLGELTYEPEITTPEGETTPLHEQSADSPGDHISDEKETHTSLDETPFTPVDIKILNYLGKTFSKEELREIWEEDETNLTSKLRNNYTGLVKVFGEETGSWEDFARASRFAKMGI